MVRLNTGGSVRTRQLGLGGSLLFLLVGLGCLFGGSVTLQNRLDLSRNGIRTSGSVVRVDSKIDDEGGRLFRPVVAYTDQDGQELSYAPNGWSSQTGFSVGDQAPIVYDRNNPDRAMIDAGMDKWFLPIFLLGFGLLMGSTGAFSLRRAMRGVSPNSHPAGSVLASPSASAGAAKAESPAIPTSTGPSFIGPVPLRSGSLARPKSPSGSGNQSADSVSQVLPDDSPDGPSPTGISGSI